MINEKYVVYNPKNKPLKELPIIYGFNNGGSDGFMHGQLIAEDGTAIGSHLCSNEGYMLSDLGILKGTRSDRHKTFEKHYPEGYRMDFISKNEAKEHEGLSKAIALNKEAGEAADALNASVEITMSND